MFHVLVLLALTSVCTQSVDTGLTAKADHFLEKVVTAFYPKSNQESEDTLVSDSTFLTRLKRPTNAFAETTKSEPTSLHTKYSARAPPSRLV